MGVLNSGNGVEQGVKSEKRAILEGAGRLACSEVGWRQAREGASAIIVGREQLPVIGRRNPANGNDVTGETATAAALPATHCNLFPHATAHCVNCSLEKAIRLPALFALL